MSRILILGAGFTGSRVASILRAQGHDVVALHRTDIDFTRLDAAAALARVAPEQCVVLHSVPSLENNADARLVAGLDGKARRVVYLSTTGVYGSAEHVDESTAVAPRNERERHRVETERAVASGNWETLILRPAAIYGPGRGVHVAVSKGAYTLLGDGANYISRIHVDDLARLSAAALLSNVTGAYPVADELACPSREIADYCAGRFGLPPAVQVDVSQVPLSRRTNRQVDGRAIFRLHGLTLLYPTYREGLEADPWGTGSTSSP